MTQSEGFTLRVDFNHSTGNTQSGWQSISAVDTAAGDSWSKNFSGGISLDADVLGGIVLDSRDRNSGNGGGGESNMWRDFLFANGSFSNASGSGIRLSLTGLQPNTEYPVKIWAFDTSSPNRAADWSGGGSATERLFMGTTTPSTLNDSFVEISVITDGSGAVTIEGIVSANNPSSSHNVFVNGLEIGNPVATDGPTGLALSNTVVASTAPIGTTVGILTTIDPTPGDSFTYTLVTGDGSSDNALFEIIGSTLRTDRDLSAFPGGTTLQARVRTTDAAAGFFEQAFLIEVVNDSDSDGLDDDWELTYFANLTIATGTGNNDGDALNNLQEQAAGTNPTLTDTDGDNLSDSDEVNTHGSNPLIVDTDGDGLNDDVEVSSANGYATDPTEQDTDRDNFNDALEISEGTDPTNASDFPNTLIPLRLNEILTRNVTGIDDGFGNREDWIEIYNPNSQAVNLDAYYLTDNANLKTKWNFPAVTISANGYLLVFASGKDTVDGSGNPHTNFNLDANGEYLAIVRPDGVTVDDSFNPTYPEQFSDISYGPPASGGAPVFFQTRTPKAANSSAAFPGVVKDTNFTVDRGFYDTPFALTISSDTPGATIRYTLDGSKPSASSGIVYSGPINITTTSTVRAIATLSGWLPTNVDSHTYIFVDDVVQQGTTIPGWPNDWGVDSEVGLVPSDYEMDDRVVNNTNGLGIYTVQEALRDIPTVAISMNQADITGGSGGVLTNPKGRFERECSIEYILPDGTTGFQEDCKIETQGNSSRRPARMQKHSMRLTFSSTVGIPKLNYDLFPDSDIDEFNKLVLRACFTDSWALSSWSSSRYRPNDSQYTRDVWMKEAMTDMGHASGHGNFVHLYYNGVYFGVHNLTERIEDDWYADHIGGEKEDWLVNKDLTTPPARWNTMMGILNGSITNNSVYEQSKDYLDMENYIDYMFLHYLADAEDWPAKNGYAAANAVSGDGKFRFQVWDQEIALDKYSWNRYSSGSGAGAPIQRLRLNEEFRMLFADRVYKHMFHGGALSETESQDRFLNISNMIDKAIVAESARWGDTQANTPYGNTASSSTNIDSDHYPPTINNPIYFTREQHWIVERDNVINNYIPTLHDQSDSRSTINELRGVNLYPSIDPPEYAQHGGVVPTGFDLGVSANIGAIYFTTDGSDPREVGGGINPNAGMITGGKIVDSFLDFEATGWRYLDNAVAQSDSNIVVGHPSYNSNDWKHPNYNPAGWKTGQAALGFGVVGSLTLNAAVAQNTPRHTVYFRKQFNVTNAADYTQVTFDIIRDDGAIVYLNGKEVGRSNITAGTKSFSDLAVSSSPEDEVVALATLTLSPGDLFEGTNTIAVEVHQASTGSSDLGLDLRVRGIKPNSGSNSVMLTQTGTLKARALNAGEWSALQSADFIVGTPASASNLVVSEVFYNPIGTSEETEWIELMNISGGVIDLTDVSFLGLTYQFAPGTVLSAGQRIVIVKNQTAFAAAYNTAGINIAPGGFTGSLRNSGEEIAVLDSTGLTDIRRFTYDDSAPWPTAADGMGYSLTLISPMDLPAHGVGTNWRSSAFPGGTPGTGDATTFTGTATNDLDNDGLNALLEYALGSSEFTPSPEAFPDVSLTSDGTNDYLTISFTRNLAADDISIVVQVSSDLNVWDDLGTTLLSVTPNGDGTETVTYRSLTLTSAEPKEFIRLSVSQ
ncbi:MAG: lamin tail domain-containing protein [Akkermansiaceae bacterium]